jgi:hypothetical protein
MSRQYLQLVADNINRLTTHKIKLSFTQGCGVYLTIDGKEYSKQLDENQFTGISNKHAMEILEPYAEESRKIGIEKYMNRINEAE